MSDGTLGVSVSRLQEGPGNNLAWASWVLYEPAPLLNRAVGLWGMLNIIWRKRNYYFEPWIVCCLKNNGIIIEKLNIKLAYVRRPTSGSSMHLPLKKGRKSAIMHGSNIRRGPFVQGLATLLLFWSIPNFSHSETILRVIGQFNPLDEKTYEDAIWLYSDALESFLMQNFSLHVKGCDWGQYHRVGSGNLAWNPTTWLNSGLEYAAAKRFTPIFGIDMPLKNAEL